ncbi:MAG: class I SAM-dependent methyltransferase [Aestuariivita sp.]|uniref:hypothetical protein n=1 Tax=Aestuariivita sp. TaxID=1872407 RepID=UPI003BAFA307
MSVFKRLFYKNRKFYDDDFDWENYTADSYHRRIQTDIETQFRASSTGDQLSFDPETGQVSTRDADIHPNQLLILETIGQLRPASVHEVGCGGGDHLATAAQLFPTSDFTGGDRGATQLELALRRHPELNGKLGLQDITMPFSHAWPKPEMVYTQAVIMHIHTAVSHFVALSNLVRQAQKYVVLVENPQCHNFVADLEVLMAGGHLDWSEMHIHMLTGSTGGRGILLSKEALDYPRLTSDAQLRDGIKASARRLKRSNEDSARAIAGFARTSG